MKIYNEVTSIFNDVTGKWETISEDSFDYKGPMALAQGVLPSNSTPIAASDTITDTLKTTTGYFTNGDGTLAGTDIYTGSLADANEKYYFNVVQSDPTATPSTAETQFSVTFGHYAGSGSDTYGDSSNNPNTLRGETQAIYQQLAQLLLEEQQVSGGFMIAQTGTDLGGGSLASGDKDQYIWALIGKRERFKDRINKKSWTLRLSGSNSLGTLGITTFLTDDSKHVAAVATPGGPRYNIVSGTLGTPTGSNAAIAYLHKSYGWFYPEMGIMLFSGAQLSASIPGPMITSELGSHLNVGSASAFAAGTTAAAEQTRASSSGFHPTTYNKLNGQNGVKFVNCLANNDGETAFRLRAEEDQTQENYFCRVRANEYNFSSNPTFVSGSKNKIRNADMHGNPQTFITGVGLYNSAGQLLAVAKLSSPLKKNFASEATIKVKLTY